MKFFENFEILKFYEILNFFLKILKFYEIFEIFVNGNFLFSMMSNASI